MRRQFVWWSRQLLGVVTSRGKTTPDSTSGSFAPHAGGKSRVVPDTDTDAVDPDVVDVVITAMARDADGGRAQAENVVRALTDTGLIGAHSPAAAGSRFVRSSMTPVDKWADGCKPYQMGWEAGIVDEWRADRDSVELMHELAHAGAVPNGVGTWQPVFRRLGIAGEACTPDMLRAGDVFIAADKERERCDLHTVIRTMPGTPGLAGFVTMTASFTDDGEVRVRPDEVHYHRDAWSSGTGREMFRVARND